MARKKSTRFRKNNFRLSASLNMDFPILSSTRANHGYRGGPSTAKVTYNARVEFKLIHLAILSGARDRINP